MLEFLAAIERHLMTIRRLLAGSTSLTDDQLRATPIDVSIVSGTVTIGADIEITNDVGNPISISASTLPLPTDAATETTLGTLLKPADTLNKVNTLDTITNQVTVNVGLTDAELRASPVPISGAGDATANFLSWLGCTLNNTMDEIILAGTPITATITTHSSLTVKEY